MKKSVFIDMVSVLDIESIEEFEIKVKTSEGRIEIIDMGEG